MHKGHTKSNLTTKFHFVLRRFYVFNIPKRYTLSWRRSRTLRYSAIAVAFALTLLILAAIAPIYRESSITEAATGTAQSSTITLAVSNNLASVDLSVDSDNGTFSSSDSSSNNGSSSISFNVKTNNYTGYKLSLSGTNNNQALVNNVSNSDGTYASLSSITSSIDTATFSANTSTAGSNYNGKYGIVPSKYKSGSSIITNTGTNATYVPAPTTTALVLDETSSANASAANHYTIGIGARASYSQPAGTYTGTYTLNVVANSIAYTIQYHKGNTTDTVGSLPGTQSSSTSNTSVALSNNTPTRTGYDFNGWCMGTISTTNGVDSCTGTGAKTFAKGGSFGIDQTTTNTTTLYAMWTPKKYTITIKTNIGINSVSLNGTNCTNASGCNVTNLSYGQSYTLTATLATGYDFVSWANSANLGTIRSTTTASTTFTVGLGATTLTPSAQRHLYTVTVSRSNASSVTFTNKNNTDSSRCPTRSNISATSTTLCYGVVYNLTMNNPTGYSLVSWATAANGTLSSTTAANPTYSVTNNTTLTATAGRTLYTVNLTRNNVASVTFTNTSTDTGRCPTRSNVSAASTTLCYGVSYTITMSPATGYSFSSWATATNGTLGSTSATSTTYKVTGASTLTASANNYGKCTNPATCMQLYTKATCQTNASSAAVTLTDARDGNTYTVRYINGNCWMTQNMWIAGGTTLTSALSNVSASYTIPTTDLTSGNSNTDGRIHNSGNASIGYYYNYCAASAGTICAESTSTLASYSICPAGWRLPTYAEIKTIASADGDATYYSAFNVVSGAGYYNGNPTLTGGWWWTATANNTGRRYVMTTNGSKLTLGPTSGTVRVYGIEVRCIRTS